MKKGKKSTNTKRSTEVVLPESDGRTFFHFPETGTTVFAKTMREAQDIYSKSIK